MAAKSRALAPTSAATRETSATLGDVQARKDQFSSSQSRWAWVLAAGIAAALILAWTVVILTTQQARFAALHPEGQAGVEAAGAVARLFGALVLILFPLTSGRVRLYWVSAGLAVLGLGGLVFGYMQPLLDMRPDLNSSVYESLVTRTLAGALFAIGLVPATPVHLSRRGTFICGFLFAALGTAAVALTPQLPRLTHIPNASRAALYGHTVLPGLTGWYWVLSSVSLLVALAAVAGASIRFQSRELGGWLLLAMVLLAGSQLHGMLWPSTYSPLVTTADLLRLAFALVVVAGGVLELRRVAAERAALLLQEREQAQRLTDLAVLKSDFTRMVAHELGSPLAAIRGFTRMLATGEVSAAETAQVLAAIQTETDVMTRLVEDVRAAATIERDDFAVKPYPLPLRTILADAVSFARTLPGDHRLVSPLATTEMVWADRERIGAVLRNLLSNAAKYSPSGTPIELRVIRSGSMVRIEVADQGFGIHPDDMSRILEKFGRGRDLGGQRVGGVGLGLYLSRRIVQAHRSDLRVESQLGAGSVFGFELEVVV